MCATVQALPVHPRVTRRTLIQAGALGLVGLGTNHLQALRAAGGESGSHAAGFGQARAAIYIFLSGGLAQQDSFDLKPEAPDNVRGEFKPIATRTPGVQICEHLPLLAERSQFWALVRSLTHRSNDHSAGHHIMLTGRSELPPGFDPGAARPADWPSIAAVAGYAVSPRNNLPPAVMLPERLIHSSGRVIPGQFAGILGARHEPWLVEASPFHATSYGAFPEYQFDHQERGHPDQRLFQAPNLSLPQGVDPTRFGGRLDILSEVEKQRRRLDRLAEAIDFDRYRQGAISLLADPKVKSAFDVTRADDRTQDRYGRNSFGWSLLMARRLVEIGVNLVQVHLGNDETWDTHGEAFPHLRDKLLPPTDKAVSALLDDLHESGLLESTLIVMAGEFGRTPKITHLPQYYKLPGRDHWGAVQTVFLAGGGIGGGTVVGSSDKIGAFPASEPQTPENLAATIYHALGIPSLAVFHDALDRPHQIYHGGPIKFA
ncbi:MAG TPA: DUF1501 domain-containing protein [Pirellulales bacterium]|nr:DUF1501 domain-containing protein [Pirellulales bacterium]